jgi:DNA-binding protein HU-beta
MTKKDLISAVQAEFNSDPNSLTKKQVGAIIEALFDSIGEAIKEEGRYSQSGFGTFTVKTRAARTGRNPQTGDSITIPESKSIGFKPAPELKKAAN